MPHAGRVLMKQCRRRERHKVRVVSSCKLVYFLSHEGGEGFQVRKVK